MNTYVDTTNVDAADEYEGEETEDLVPTQR